MHSELCRKLTEKVPCEFPSWISRPQPWPSLCPCFGKQDDAFPFHGVCWVLVLPQPDPPCLALLSFPAIARCLQHFVLWKPGELSHVSGSVLGWPPAPCPLHFQLWTGWGLAGVTTWFWWGGMSEGPCASSLKFGLTGCSGLAS